MICFRSLNYFWLIPTMKYANILAATLWFAFVLWTTFDWYQPVIENLSNVFCCDLLSFFELLLIDTNGSGKKMKVELVVICFRSLNYFWLIPTFISIKMDIKALWFAFVLWTTFDWYQPEWTPEYPAGSCDLLSFFELLLIDTNSKTCKV